MFEETAEPSQRDPAFLVLRPDIDLDEAVGEAGCPAARLDQRIEQRRAVKRVDGIEHGHGFGRLVGLQLADHVQPKVRMSIAERRPFGDGFLHPAFAELALAGGDQREDVVNIMRFGDRDQRDVRRSALRLDRGRANKIADQR